MGCWNQRVSDWNADGGQRSTDPDNCRSQSPQQQTSASKDHIDESGQRRWGIDVSRLSKGSYSHDRCRRETVEPKNTAMLCAPKVRKVKVGMLLPGLRSNLDIVNFGQCRDSIPCFLRAYPELD